LEEKLNQQLSCYSSNWSHGNQLRKDNKTVFFAQAGTSELIIPQVAVKNLKINDTSAK